MYHPHIGFNYVTIYGVDLDEWCKRYELDQFEVECMMCGAIRKVCIPFAGGTYRGIMADECVCGDGFPPMAYVDVNKDSLLNKLCW